jgi:hypothetical protein
LILLEHHSRIKGERTMHFLNKFLKTNSQGTKPASAVPSGHRVGRTIQFATTAIVAAAAVCFLSAGSSFAQSCVPPAFGINAWWTGDGDGGDFLGNNSGTLHNGLTFGNGVAGQSFLFDGFDDYMSVAASPSLDVGTGSGMTLECWINPADTNNTHMMFEWNDGNGNVGAQFCHSDSGIGGLGAFFANLVDTSGFNHIFASPPGILVPGTWQHIAMTYDNSTGTGTLYRNGVVVRSQNIGVFTVQTTYDLYVGTRISGQVAVGIPYSGLMDELSLYNRALSSDEISAIYNGGSAGKCKSNEPIIITQPASRSVHAGQSPQFMVAASGFSLSYQWQFQGADLPGATNATLTVTNAQGSQAGIYSVIVSNAFGFTNSADATLTVDSTCFSAPAGLVSWWPGENTAVDAYGGHDGALQGGLAFASGEVGQAFDFDGANDYFNVPASALLDVGASDGFTLECWVNPTDISSAHCIGEWNNGGGGIGVHLWHSDQGIGGKGSLLADIVNIDGTAHVFTTAANVLTTNNLQHVALTYSKTSGIGKLFRNGVVVGTAGLGTIRPQTTFSLYFGTRISGASSGGFYRGIMDEIGLYNRALGDSEVQSIYLAGSSGKTCIPPEILTQPLSQHATPGTNVTFAVSARGTTPLICQWYFNSSPLGGATNTSLTLSNVQGNSSGNYSVRVTNALGFAFSSNAFLKIDVVTALGNGQPLTNSPALFAGSVTVQLRNAYTNGLIFYTLDGSPPSFSSSQYTGPFTLSQSATLRALGYSADFFQSGELDPIHILIVPSYKLILTNSPGGSVAKNPSSANYLSNSLVTITASASPGWTFLQWLGDVTGTNASTSVTMNRDKFVQAVFGTTLSTTVAGNGLVTVNPPGGIYPYGTVVWLSGIPQPGNAFAIWGNAASGNVNPLAFGITNANQTVSSLFSTVASGQAALTVVPTGNGRVSVSPRANTYTVGANVLVTATPDASQSFIGWSGDASGSQNPLSVTMSQNKLIYANFTHNTRLSVGASYEGLKPEGFVLSLRGDFGAGYEIDSSTNLLNWSSLATVTNSFGTIQLLDFSATNASRKFYRSLLLP